MAWRDTALAPRMGPLDARAIIAIGVWALHFALWTFLVGVSGVAGFWLAERRGYTPTAWLRSLRTRMAGKRRLPTDRGLFRNAHVARMRIRGYQ